MATPRAGRFSREFAWALVMSSFAVTGCVNIVRFDSGPSPQGSSTDASDSAGGSKVEPGEWVQLDVPIGTGMHVLGEPVRFELVDLDVAAEAPFRLDGQLPTGGMYRQCFHDPTEMVDDELLVDAAQLGGNIDVHGTVFAVDRAEVADVTVVTDWLSDELGLTSVPLAPNEPMRKIDGDGYKVYVTRFDAEEVNADTDYLILIVASSHGDSYCADNIPSLAAGYQAKFDGAVEERSIELQARWRYGLFNPGSPNGETEGFFVGTDVTYDAKVGAEEVDLGDGTTFRIRDDGVEIELDG